MQAVQQAFSLPAGSSVQLTTRGGQMAASSSCTGPCSAVSQSTAAAWGLLQVAASERKVRTRCLKHYGRCKESTASSGHC